MIYDYSHFESSSVGSLHIWADLDLYPAVEFGHDKHIICWGMRTSVCGLPHGYNLFVILGVTCDNGVFLGGMKYHLMNVLKIYLLYFQKEFTISWFLMIHTHTHTHTSILILKFKVSPISHWTALASGTPITFPWVTLLNLLLHFRVPWTLSPQKRVTLESNSSSGLPTWSGDSSMFHD